MSTTTDKIHQAIKSALADKYRLAEGEWGSQEAGCMCPLGCALWAGGVSIVEDWRKNRDNAARLLGVSDKWVEHFISGFDGAYIVDLQVVPEYIDAFEYGCQFRAQYQSEWQKEK
jgi:hypothetical protein